MIYTAEDFDRTAAVLRDFFNDESDLPLDLDRVNRLVAALRIASAVMSDKRLFAGYRAAIMAPSDAEALGAFRISLLGSTT